MFLKKKTSQIITNSLEIEKLLTNNVEEIIGVDELRKKLLSGRKLRIKFGVDITRPNIHIGHAVGLRKLREFQKLGHTVIFLIGDATTRIGDPSGRDKTRPLLTEKEIQKNSKTYTTQVEKILDADKTEIRRNSEWFDKMSMFDFIKLLTFVTHSQIINREAFQKRIKEGKEIFAHELIYPILQGYDSVVLKADAAVHADQLFNEHFGRMYQEKFKQEPQAIITVSMLVGIDGKNKMSKSLDNYIGITDNSNDMFGKVMSIPDNIILDYFRMATDMPIYEIDKIKTKLESGANPKDIKIILAKEIVKIYYEENEAQKAKENFTKTFAERGAPENIKEIIVNKGTSIYDAVLELVKSKNELRRLIGDGAVSEVNGNKINDIYFKIEKDTILKIGKRRFLKIKIK
ncbi:tyrosine--tRNA ligase [Candidatus Campbellbacteria bacterium CG10_big_fil_rev_8_21_14_0_10_35_52]|uniref:Tyrosine--tRNA ligase n=1 Tax=Candidatus Campbellbacteria bacterium CG10_big_fil_rev_8_21_14_0_10_35_52 TaxID=1974527 RepID=A0A2M6WUR5_9BACT|nr:MAG: tyrosine--tRNA ligase [Candidatus Campbellbacteria bacterium CG10_big_fil_rev_8_21_14_0_10_35_52]